MAVGSGSSCPPGTAGAGSRAAAGAGAGAAAAPAAFADADDMPHGQSRDGYKYDNNDKIPKIHEYDCFPIFL